MSWKRLVALMSSACASLLLAGCVPGLVDDGSRYFGRGEIGRAHV